MGYITQSLLFDCIKNINLFQTNRCGLQALAGRRSLHQQRGLAHPDRDSPDQRDRVQRVDLERRGQTTLAGNRSVNGIKPEPKWNENTSQFEPIFSIFTRFGLIFDKIIEFLHQFNDNLAPQKVDLIKCKAQAQFLLYFFRPQLAFSFCFSFLFVRACSQFY